jgi:tetratricopeptide (TPR) repeat protein
MSKYSQDLDDFHLITDISEAEAEAMTEEETVRFGMQLGGYISKDGLAEIIVEADRIILENKEPSEKIAEAYLKKSQCLRKLGKSEESKAVIEKALELAPTMPEVIFQLAELTENEDEAIALFAEVQRLKPSRRLFVKAAAYGMVARFFKNIESELNKKQ